VGLIHISTLIDASPARVWEVVRHIERHVDWMVDAEAIRFTSPQRSDVGTTFDCDTRVGPFRLTDRMEITEWRPEETMGVRHSGLVTGTGRFTLTGQPDDRTRFAWEERLVFPWWMGGPIGGVVGGRVLRFVWKRNLRALKLLVGSA
jgi:hypothetical protein